MSQRLAMPGGKRFARKLNLTPKLLVAMQLWDTVRAQASGMCKLMLSDRSQFPIGFFFHFTVFHFQWGGVYPVSIRHSGHFESTVHAWRLPRHWEYWPQVLLFILTADTHTDYGGGPNVSMFFTRFEDRSISPKLWFLSHPIWWAQHALSSPAHLLLPLSKTKGALHHFLQSIHFT